MEDGRKKGKDVKGWAEKKKVEKKNGQRIVGEGRREE